jgi:hypothetical protein
MSSKATKAAIGIVAIAVIGLVLWKLRPRGAEQAGTVPEPGSAAEATAGEPASAAAPSARVDDSGALKRRLADEIRARQRAEAEAAALREKIAPLESNVVVSLGKVEDIGKRAGVFLPALAALEALSGRDPSTLSPDEKRQLLELQRDHAKLLGALPEIARFQDNPDEYGRFFSSMFQQAAGLTDPQAAQVQAFMRERAVVMNQLELNAGKEPTDPKLEEAWEERRDKFNEQTAEGLKGILPPGAAEKINFGPELMEFLEMDFDKLTPQASEKKP